jgi:hypothetical protein
MEQCPFEKVPVPMAVKKLPVFFLNLEVPYHVHKNAQFGPIRKQMNPVQAYPFHATKIHFDIILPSTPTSSTMPHSFRFSKQNRKIQIGIVIDYT